MFKLYCHWKLTHQATNYGFTHDLSLSHTNFLLTYELAAYRLITNPF